MATTIWTKQAAAGIVEVTDTDILVSGVKVGARDYPVRVRLTKPLADGRSAVWVIGGKVVLTEDERNDYESTLRAYDRAKADADPRIQRERLVDALRAARYGEDDAREDVMSEHNDGSDFRAVYASEAAVKTAREALAAFDAAHPEIIAAIRAAKAVRDAETLRSAEWN